MLNKPYLHKKQLSFENSSGVGFAMINLKFMKLFLNIIEYENKFSSINKSS